MSEVGAPLESLDTPALWVDLEAMEANIAALAAAFGEAGIDWRPHIKGIKVPAIAQRLVRAGAIGVTCAKLGEAEVMARAGIDDILVANQVVGPAKIRRLVHLSRRTGVKVAVDDADNAAQIGAAAAGVGAEVGVLVEVDTGMARAGVRPGEAAVELSRLVHATPGLRYRGLMAWEGHAARVSDFEEKREVVAAALALLRDSAEQCRAAGLPVEIVSGGGSITYTITPALGVVSEIQAGGAVFSDVTYRDRHVETEPAIFLRATVTSRPTPTRVVCDAGFKALPSWYREPEPLGLPALSQFRSSAEHGILDLETAESGIKVGDAINFIPGYTDSTLFLHDTLYGVRRGVVESVWPVEARGKLR